MTKATEVSSEERLRHSGLRPTRQRVALADLIFAKGDRHLTVEELHEEAVMAGVPVSLATVYNTLHQFTSVGLLKEVVIGSGRSYFDTNTCAHHHFYFASSGRLQDIPEDRLKLERLPEPPAGTRLRRVDVIIVLDEASEAQH